MTLDTICAIKNRSSSLVGYKIPEKNIRREFAPGEVKRVTFEEIQLLSYQPGGLVLLIDFLQVNPDVLSALGYTAEPEYYMDEDQIKDLLLNGSIDEFLDCLDFAPNGVINLIKQFAVSLPLSDLQKRKALKRITGFDVDKALIHIEEEKEPEAEEETTKTRRVKTTQETTAANTGRSRRAESKYKVVNRGE